MCVCVCVWGGGGGGGGGVGDGGGDFTLQNLQLTSCFFHAGRSIMILLRPVNILRLTQSNIDFL